MILTMDFGVDILYNPWVTGIGGGIISSLIVFFITKYCFTKKENKEYLQKIKTANNEIFYSIRPLIIEKKIPTIEILTAIRISLAQKYGLKKEDLYNELSLYNDLITDIMSNSFLTSEQKLDFCELLKPMNAGVIEKNQEIEYVYKYSLSARYSSILLSITSFFMVLVSTLLIARRTDVEILFDIKENILLVVTSIIVPLLTMFVFLFIKEKKHKLSNQNNNKKSDNVDNKYE